jgi:hypothetical protein
MPWNRKTIVSLLLLMFLSSSFYPKSKKMLFAEQVFYKHVPATAEQGILVSCAKCSCFLPVMDSYMKQAAHRNMFIGADSNCTRMRFPNHVSQSGMDEISEDFYNVVLFRKKGNMVQCRVVTTIESSRFEAVCKRFFQ